MAVRLDRLIADPALRSHVHLHGRVVIGYNNQFLAGRTCPPVVVFDDGFGLWLADGYHRLMAVRLRGWAEIPALVVEGTRRDALLYSASRQPGHPRWEADVRRAIWVTLDDPVWADRPDQEVADQVGCSEIAVRRLRREKQPYREAALRRKLVYEEKRMAKKNAQDIKQVTVTEMEHLLGEAMADDPPAAQPIVDLPEPTRPDVIDRADGWRQPNTTDSMLLRTHLASADALIKELRAEVIRLQRLTTQQAGQIAALREQLQK